ncbi:hypothetical protein OG689_26095 [Kitasatospora sp. NBC_00240]|uniref:hypothetical protein n=1 Tax=Kitasatospora sp. NBC_00240 TaxID=2903567 RepID=UPI002257083F|nr:hypothetical protein [Kitasatospora sp. NBC_00240]MCX5212714.1 hypothetical protein [Kitasatospora sp. NBC_00240]
MLQTNRALRRAGRVVPAAVLTAGLLAGGAVTAAPAFAGGAPLTLTVQPPSSIGAAGGPVEFTETIANPGGTGWAVVLQLTAETAAGAGENFISIEARNELNGLWDAVPVTLHHEQDKDVFSAEVIGKIIVPAGEKKDVHLRLGAPMGKPHDGASNGGVGPAVTLRSEVKGWWQDTPVEPAVRDTRTIKVDAISNELAGVPAKAVAGGAPVEFDAVLRNPSPSAYTNLGNVLFADKHAKVEVRRADGTWSTLTGITVPDGNPGQAGFYLDGRNSSAAPASTTTDRVRLSYPAGTPGTAGEVRTCVFVNESQDTPFHGTTFCAKGATIAITEAATPRPTTPAPAGTSATPAQPSTAATSAAAVPAAVTSASPTATATATADAPAPAGRLAVTGADGGRTGLLAGIAALLIGAGIAAFVVVRRRRADGTA